MPDNTFNSTPTYRFISWILFPATFLYTWFLAVKFRNWRYLRERLGKYIPSQDNTHLVWCHCASVGEVNTALPLFKRLLKRDQALLISTNTITGQQTLQNAKLDNITPIYLPLDYARFINKLLIRYQPKCFLVFETELWPNLFSTLHKNKIPIAIINGRISDKTLNAPHFLHTNYARILANVSKIVASSEENAQRFTTLGADASKIEILENLKFALPAMEASALTRPLTFPYILCASTHADEELQIIHQWQQNKVDAMGLVIALRHPQRVNDVCKQIQSAGLQYELHSKQPQSMRPDYVYIIDTLGELAPFLAYAELVFMGGSLVPVGGHNVLEPAGMSKCILTGPYYQNFQTIIDELADTEAIKIVKDVADFMQTANELAKNKSLRTQMGENARRYVESKQGLLDQYEQWVVQFIQN